MAYAAMLAPLPALTPPMVAVAFVLFWIYNPQPAAVLDAPGYAADYPSQRYTDVCGREKLAVGGVKLPAYDRETMVRKTLEAPVWVHFGAGNIFRGFSAGLQQRLLDAGEAEKGIIAAESFDTDIVHKIYEPHDNLALVSTLKADGTTEEYFNTFIITNIPYKSNSILENSLIFFFTKSAIFKQHRTIRCCTSYYICNYIMSIIIIEKKDIR